VSFESTHLEHLEQKTQKPNKVNNYATKNIMAGWRHAGSASNGG
jgi:hypothetical protein